MRKLIIALGISLLILCSIGLSSAKTVEFYSDPVGAALYVDGSYKGTTSSYAYGVLTVSLTETTHSYVFKKSGYEDASGTIDVSKLSVVSERLDLATSTPDPIPEPTPDPEPDIIPVQFYSDPVGASLYVDGTYKGITSSYAYGVLTVNLAPGTHSYTFKKSGYYDESGTYSVSSTSYTVSEKLDPIPAEPTPEPEDPAPTPEPDQPVSPTAVITTTQPSQTTIIFDSASSYDSDSTIVARTWSLDGRSVSTATQYQLVTSDLAEGTHTVKLTVTDDTGLSGSSQYLIKIENQKITEHEVIESTPETTDGTTGNTGGTTFMLPGFGSIPALIGLIAVAWAVRRGEYDN